MTKIIMKKDFFDFHFILSESARLVKAYCFQTRAFNSLFSIQPKDVLQLKPQKKDSISHVDENRNDGWQALKKDSSEDENFSAGIG